MEQKDRLFLVFTELAADIKAIYTQIAGLSGAAFIPVEINFGSTPRRSGQFSITGTGFAVGKPVNITQAVGPYTGKGTLADECEMDTVAVKASVISATEIKCYWESNTFVMGNFKFNYIIGG